jgi:hypothetical protein
VTPTFERWDSDTAHGMGDPSSACVVMIGLRGPKLKEGRVTEGIHPDSESCWPYETL